MSLLRRVLVLLLLAAGIAAAYGLVRAQLEARHNIPVLTYHYFRSAELPRPVIPQGLASYYVVDIGEFERQLDYLRSQGYHAVSFTDLCRAKRFSDLPDKPVVITVDHEATDRVALAVPALRARGMTATFFVVTGWIGRPGNCTAADLKAMADSGMDVQSHTVTHPTLSQIAPERQFRELADSRSQLEAMTGHPVLTMAPPGGKWNASTVTEAKRAGYLGLRITDPGFNHVGDYVYGAITLPGRLSDADFARLLSPSSIATAYLAHRVAAAARGLLGGRYQQLRAFLIRHGLDRFLHSPRARLYLVTGTLGALAVLVLLLPRKRRR